MEFVSDVYVVAKGSSRVFFLFVNGNCSNPCPGRLASGAGVRRPAGREIIQAASLIKRTRQSGHGKDDDGPRWPTFQRPVHLITKRSPTHGGGGNNEVPQAI